MAGDAPNTSNGPDTSVTDAVMQGQVPGVAAQPSVSQAPATNAPPQTAAAPAQQPNPIADEGNPPAPAPADRVQKFVQSASTPTNKLWRGVVSGALAGLATPSPTLSNKEGTYISASPNLPGVAQNIQANREKTQARQDMLDNQARQKKQQDFENNVKMSDLEMQKAADARAQLNSIQQTQEFGLRMKMFNQQIEAGDWAKAQRNIDAIQKTVDRLNTYQEAGGKPLMINGNPVEYENTPDGLKQLDADLHKNPSFFIKDFTTREVVDPNTGKISVWEIPSEEKDFSIKDDSGNIHNVRMRPTDYITYKERIANIELSALDKKLKATEIMDRINQTKKDGEYTKALEAYDKVGGDVTSPDFPPSARAVLGDHEAKNYTAAMTALAKAQQDGDAETVQMAADQAKRSAAILASLYAGRQPKPTQTGPAPAPDAQAPKGYQLTAVDTAPFTRVVGRGATYFAIPNTTPDDTAKIYKDLNGMQSPADRKKYIAGLNIGPEDKAKLTEAALKSEQKPPEAMVSIIDPNGKIRQIPESQKAAALAAGGTLPSE